MSQGRLPVEVLSKLRAEPKDAGESIWPRGGERSAGGRGSTACKNLVVRMCVGGGRSSTRKDTDFEQSGGR